MLLAIENLPAWVVHDQSKYEKMDVYNTNNGYTTAIKWKYSVKDQYISRGEVRHEDDLSHKQDGTGP